MGIPKQNVMTVKEIANLIANDLNRPFDGLLINRIMRLIIVEYNKIVKEQLNKSNRYDEAYRTKYFVTSFTESA